MLDDTQRFYVRRIAAKSIALLCLLASFAIVLWTMAPRAKAAHPHDGDRFELNELVRLHVRPQPKKDKRHAQVSGHRHRAH